MDNNREFFSTQVPLTNSVCIFSHDFEITAGYDFEKIVPQVEPKTGNKKGTITISLPKAKILSNGMVPDKEHVYYEKESIFNNLSEEEKAELRKKMGKRIGDKNEKEDISDHWSYCIDCRSILYVFSIYKIIIRQ